jgi:hypothetical protein
MKKFFCHLRHWLARHVAGVGAVDNIGTLCRELLKIGVGARSEAMAGAFVAQVSDMSALYWNPAGMSSLAKREVLIHRTDWVLDINHIYVAAGLPINGFGTLGFSVSSLSMGDFEQTTPESPDGTGVMFSSMISPSASAMLAR